MILNQIICLSNSELLLKLKELNEFNEIISEMPFKDLLKEIIFPPKVCHINAVYCLKFCRREVQ